MANAVQAPAPAEGPTSHTQNQAARLSSYQLRMLHKGIAASRIQHKQGQAHVEAWDVRRHLIRIFGFGGYSTKTLALDLVAEREAKQGDRSRWTVVYRAQVRLTVYSTDGREIAYFEDGAAGDAINQPKLGDAHDMAMKTALSQALKRCATNLGDQFGLSLYNGGRPEPVVNFSAAHPPQEWQQQEVAPQPEPEDPPVQPEPQPAVAEDTGPSSTPQAPVQQQARPAPAPAPHSAELAAEMDKLYRQAIEQRMSANVLTQIRAAAKAKDVIDMEVDGPPPEKQRMPFGQFLDVLELMRQEAAAQRNVA